MNKLFSALSRELDAGKSVMIVTIIAEEGSSPRGTGAKMLVGEHGRIFGSIGGGAVEKRSEELALDFFSRRESGIHDYYLREGAQEDIGMVCGGDVTVMFQYADCANAAWLSAARDAAGKAGVLVSGLDGNAKFIGSAQEAHAGFTEILAKKGNRPVFYDNGLLCETLTAPVRAIIFGAGHIGSALARMLPSLGFETLLYDNRPEYADGRLFDDNINVICAPFEKISEHISVNSGDYVIIMTSGHSADYTVQEQIMRGEYYYLGVIGSKKKTAVMNSRLMAAGISEEALKKVHTPIGLSIKAVTPEEIAVSIAAELILVRAESGVQSEQFGGID